MHALTLKNSVAKPSILDLGCGSGRLIFALRQKRILKNAGEIVGVDISRSRIESLTRELPFVRGLVSDALDVKELPDSSFDVVICSQLVEHVRSDDMLMLEIRRLLKSGGLAYVSSVIKKWYGIYFYLRDGSFRLDPTHIREYSSRDEFIDLIRANGFEIAEIKHDRITYPLVDIVVSMLSRIELTKPNARYYQSHKTLGTMRKFQLPVVGYENIEVLAKRID
jgi:ubiquinone/menaquinone biosynthesis C-methylase UbiE